MISSRGAKIPLLPVLTSHVRHWSRRHVVGLITSRTLLTSAHERCQKGVKIRNQRCPRGLWYTYCVQSWWEVMAEQWNFFCIKTHKWLTADGRMPNVFDSLCERSDQTILIDCAGWKLADVMVAEQCMVAFKCTMIRTGRLIASPPPRLAGPVEEAQCLAHSHLSWNETCCTQPI